MKSQDGRALLQISNDGFWQIDDNSRLVRVNEAYCRMSGYSEAELLSMKVSDLEAPETRAETAARIEEALKRGSSCFVSRHRRKDGSFYDVECSFQFLGRGAGGLVGFLREASLLDSEADLLRSQKIARVGSYRMDIPNKTYVSTPVLDEIFGISASFPHDAEHWLTLIHPDDREATGRYLTEEVIGMRRGAETIPKLLALDPKAKVLVSSGYSDDPVMAEFQRHGFGGTLSKPYRLEDVSEALRRLIGTR